MGDRYSIKRCKDPLQPTESHQQVTWLEKKRHVLLRDIDNHHWKEVTEEIVDHDEDTHQRYPHDAQ
jgi:hypothetical protein